MTKEGKSTGKKNIHKDLLLAKRLIYDKCGFSCTAFETEAESTEYGAATFKINGRPIKFRIAKITPKKSGQFVTIWKRKEKGPIEPFEQSDDIDFLVINTRNNEKFGQFIFPKSVLLLKGIISGSLKEGKRAIRVYPPWEKATNQQAIKSQQWQLDHFLEIPNSGASDLVRAKMLFNT